MSSADQKDKVFVELAKIAQHSIEHRRAYEWKVAFGLWAAIGTATYFLAEHKSLASTGTLVAIFLVYLCLALTWLFLWQVPLHRGHAQDKDWKHYYMDKAEGESPDRPKKRRYWECDNFYSAWLWGQTIVTVLFLIASFMVIYNASDSIATGDAKINVEAHGDDIEVISKTKKLP